MARRVTHLLISAALALTFVGPSRRTSCSAFAAVRASPRCHRPTTGAPAAAARTTLYAGDDGAATGSQSSSPPVSTERKLQAKRVVVVGGGWAGFSAASALASAVGPDDDDDDRPVEVTLLDASPRGRGGLAGGWRTPQGRPVEAGIHGFWREYRNTFRVMEGIGLDLDDVLSPYTPSVLVSASGRVALAPVLGDDNGGGGSASGGGKSPRAFSGKVKLPASPLNPRAALESVAALLPPPLDVALLSEFSPDSKLTIADRLSAVGLLGGWADFGQEDPESWDRYDAVTAEDLFKKYAGVTDGLYDELISPMLHVLPMCPGYDCSAAAALSCFHVFALQTRGAFDVRWCRGGIAEKIFDPWATQLIEGGNVEIRGGARVSSIVKAGADGDGDGGDSVFPIEVQLNDGEESIECDAVILAVGGTAIGKIATASPAIRALPASRNFDKLRGVTCVAVRIFLKPSGGGVTSGLKGGKHGSTQLPPGVAEAMRDSPVLVCGPRVGGLPELDETGFCVYDLQRLHDEFAVGAHRGSGDVDETAVLEVDFFRADSIADMEDDMDVARLALRAAGAAIGATISDGGDDDIVDVAVVRARNAVSHFAVNSASYSPDVKIGDGVYMCGDWIDRTGHASWSTEKAVVTGRQAAGRVARDLVLTGCDDSVLPAAPDTEQLAALRGVARVLRSVAPPPGDAVPPSPWKFAESLLGKANRE